MAQHNDNQPLTSQHTLCPSCGNYTLTTNGNCADCGEKKPEAANDATRPTKSKAFLKG